MRCPVCGSRAERAVLGHAAHLEGPVVARLREKEPQWRPARGACARCVAGALDAAPGSGGRGRAPAGRGGHILPLSARLPFEPGYTGRGVCVAVIDSDFVLHPDFARPRTRVASYVDASRAPARGDVQPPAAHLASWHGTMVTGAGFGSGASSEGRYPGIAAEARLVLVRIAGEDVRIGEARVMRGLRWVAANHRERGIRVVNMSVGGDEPESSRTNRLDRLVRRVVDAGVVVVAAAGNRPGKRPVAPASAPEAITVGGVDDQGRGEPSEWSVFPASHGPTVDGVQKPDLLAPSIWVPAPMVPGTPQDAEARELLELEATPDGSIRAALARRIDALRLRPEILREEPHGIRAVVQERMRDQKYIASGTQHVDGTSFASAIVSAVVAQMLEANPALAPAEVKACLRETARPLPGVPREVQGAGVVDPAAAVRAAISRSGAPSFDRTLLAPLVAENRVVFRFHDPSHRLEPMRWAGAASRWDSVPMERIAPGLWQIVRPQPAPDERAYRFVLPDGRWWADPSNPLREPDGFGGWLSIVAS